MIVAEGSVPQVQVWEEPPKRTISEITARMGGFFENCSSWCDFTTWLELFLSKTRTFQPRRLARQAVLRRHQKNPLPYFFEFPPAEFLFLLKRVFSGGGVSL